MGRDGVERWRGARTTGDDRFEVDDRVGEGGAVEGLASHLERREEERCGHRREKKIYSVDVGRSCSANAYVMVSNGYAVTRISASCCFQVRKT